MRKTKGIAHYLLDNMGEYMTKDEKYMVYQVASMSGLMSRIRVACNKQIRAGYYPKDFYRILRLIINKY